MNKLTKIWKFNEILPFIKMDNVNTKNEYLEEQKNGTVWKYIGWYSPSYNGNDAEYTIKKRNGDSNIFGLWLMYIDPHTNLYYRYSFEAKDLNAYRTLLSSRTNQYH